MKRRTAARCSNQRAAANPPSQIEEHPMMTEPTTPAPATPCSVPDPCADGELCDRHETEQAHAAGDHTYCGVTCETEFPTEALRNFVLAKGYPGVAGALDELLRRAALGETSAAPQPDHDTDVMTPQQCPKGIHADWMVDSEDIHTCPWCERDELLDELGGRDDEARERWIQKQLDETGIRSMDFRNGIAMDIEPARELCAHFVGAARAMLGDAPNYSETKLEFDVKVAESPELYTLVVQRHGPGVLTPHEARQRAEKARAEVLGIVSAWCIEANDVGGVDAGDLAWRLEQAGHPLPDEDADDEEGVDDEEPEDEADDECDSDSDVFDLISEIASRLRDATDEGEYHAVGLIYDLATGRTTVGEARAELAELTFRHI